MNQHSTPKRSSDEDQDSSAARQTDALEAALGSRSIATPIALDAVAGAATGALVGAVGGPLGMAVGALIGGVVGGAAGAAVETADREKSAHQEALDRTIGVSGGHIGEAAPGQPPSHGRFLAAALGVSDSGPESSDGPIQNVDGG